MTGEDLFSQWLQGFVEALIKAGLSARQADRYRGEYLKNAKRYFSDGISCDDAVKRELLGPF